MNILLHSRTDWYLRLVPCMKAYEWREVMSPRMLEFTTNKIGYSHTSATLSLFVSDTSHSQHFLNFIGFWQWDMTV